MSDLPNDQHEPDEGDIRDYRAAKDEAAAERKKNTDLQRENAFLRAGVDLSTKAGQMFSKAYDGELTPEAIKAEAAEVNALIVTPEPEPAPQVQIGEDERAQTRERAALATGAEPPTGEVPSPDPKRQALREFQKERDDGARLEDAGAAYFDHLFAAAYTGDKRAQFDPVEWARKAGDG